MAVLRLPTGAQSLLSKSMSYFGMESTYGAAAAIAQRIFRNEIARLP